MRELLVMCVLLYIFLPFCVKKHGCEDLVPSHFLSSLHVPPSHREKGNGQCGDRTHDLGVISTTLYQLS